MAGDVIFRFWMGGTSPMGAYSARIIRRLYPQAHLLDFGERDLEDVDVPETVPREDTRQWRRHVSNVFRWKMLWSMGYGVYVDHDVVPLGRWPEGDWIAAHHTPCTCAVSLTEGSTVADRALDVIYSVSGTRNYSEDASGEAVLAKVLADLPFVPLKYDGSGALLDDASPLLHCWHGA